VAALVAALAGDDPDAVAGAAASIFTTERMLDHARAAEDAGLALRRAGRSDDAQGWLIDARSRYDALGAARDVARVSDALDGAPPRRPGHGWDGLSPEDRAVAELVAAGLANRDIASELFMSKRTVEWHVSRLYTKLDAPNRVALARLVQEQSARA